jgi:hypothetical protein
MTASIDRQAGPNTDHTGRIPRDVFDSKLHPEKPLLSDLECDIIEYKFVSLLCFAP